jgi:hypothetical protein
MVANRDRFEIVVVSPAGEKYDRSLLPFELRFACTQLPGADEKVRSLFERGIGLGIRATPRVRESILRAVDRISGLSQTRTIEPWCSQLIFHEEIPLFSDDDVAEAHVQEVNLYTEAHLILSERFAMIRIVPVDLEAHGIEDEDLAFISELNRVIEPLSAAYLHHRIRLDRRADLPSLIRFLLPTFLVIAPIVHLFELWVQAIGRLFAALSDDVIRKSSELILLHDSGFTPRQLVRHAVVYVPVLILGVVAALAAGPLIAVGSLFSAGLLFGVASVSFPVIRSLQEFADARSAYLALHLAGKTASVAGISATLMASRDLMWRPDALGRVLGILLTPFFCAFGFLLFPSLISNGWFLTLIATFDISFAILFLASARACSRATFLARVRPLVARQSPIAN